MKIALIGYGSIAVEHVKAIRALRDDALQIDAVVGRLDEPTFAFALTHGLSTATTDLDVVLADPTVDVVVVCSPTDLHAEQTEQALRAGKHVLCEIPLATSLAATDHLIGLADEVDRRLMVCHTQRYFPPLIEARRQIAAGELHPHAIVSRYLFDRRDNVNWRGRRRSWTDNLLWHHGCHAVDAALWLLGTEAVEVVSQVAPPDPHTGIPMNLSLVLRTPRDELATVVMSYHARLSQHDYLIVGEETTLHFADNALRSPAGLLVPATTGDHLSEAMVAQDAEFFAAVREGREPAISARAVRPAMAALQAAQDGFDRRGQPR